MDRTFSIGLPNKNGTHPPLPISMMTDYHIMMGGDALSNVARRCIHQGCFMFFLYVFPHRVDGNVCVCVRVSVISFSAVLVSIPFAAKDTVKILWCGNSYSDNMSGYWYKMVNCDTCGTSTATSQPRCGS